MKKITESSLSTIETWSKSKQYNKISEIVHKYPTIKEFKDAVLKSGDPQSISIIKKVPDDLDKKQYIDFLQYVFIKHSKLGKHLLSGLVGVGLGAGLAYLGGKEAEEYAKKHTKHHSILGGVVKGSIGQQLGSTAGTAGAISYARANDDDITVPELIGGLTAGHTFGGALGSRISAGPNSALGSTIGGLGDAVAGYGANTQTYGLLGTLGGAIGGGFDAAKDVNKINSYKNQGTIAGGAAGLLGGSGVTHGIQSWREKQLQKKIDSLKK